jgi:hypothetical protein
MDLKCFSHPVMKKLNVEFFMEIPSTFEFDLEER